MSASLLALEAGSIARAKLKALMDGTSSLSNSTVAANDVKRVVGQRAEGGQPLTLTLWLILIGRLIEVD